MNDSDYDLINVLTDESLATLSGFVYLLTVCECPDQLCDSLLSFLRQDADTSSDAVSIAA